MQRSSSGELQRLTTRSGRVAFGEVISSHDSSSGRVLFRTGTGSTIATSMATTIQPVTACRTTTKWFSHKRPVEEEDGENEEEAQGGVSPTYWKKRYLLFAKFDFGIQMDEESWYSVTPECIAAHIAHKITSTDRLVIFDACAGAGGNAIQFALLNNKHHVVACELDASRILLARENARVYGVQDRIEFVCGDAMQLLRAMPAGTVDYCFLSPPWGGPAYRDKDDFSLVRHVQLGNNNRSSNGVDLFQESRRVAKRGVIYYLPKQMRLARLAEELGELCSEFELHKLGRRDHSTCAYFGTCK